MLRWRASKDSFLFNLFFVSNHPTEDTLMVKLAAVTKLAPAAKSHEHAQPTDNTAWPSHNQQQTYASDSRNGETQDHFIQRNGLEFAGTHLIFDFWGATGLDNLELMEAALKKSVKSCGATLLHIHLHHFTPNGGISGVAVLAESHISVHTWPERGYAAFDVFMCGDAQPEKAIPVLQNAFKPTRLNVTEHLRGLVNTTVTNEEKH